MTTWADLPWILPHHAEFLEQAAITADAAAGGRAFTVIEQAAMPDELGPYVPLPALVFRWTSPSGALEHQARPDTPNVDESGRPMKYVFRKGMVPILWQLSTGSSVWIVEGTKQALAAASWAPAGVGVYGIAGCRSWSHEGRPVGDLAVADGKPVVVILDADAASNRDVYDAGVRLTEALKAEGAASVRFARLPAGRETGLDDLLGSRPANRRADYLARIVEDAKTKPADKAPTRKQKLTESWGRPTVVVNGDRLEVVNQITQCLQGWSGTYLFNHGGVLSRLVGVELEPLTKDNFTGLLLRVVRPVAEAPNGEIRDAMPEPSIISVVFSEAEYFAPVERVTRIPFVRADGTICQTPGYDCESQAVMVLDDSFNGVEVPDQPTDAQVTDARKLLMDDWLGDMPFAGPVDRANALALVLTPMIRGLVPRVPLAVVDGLGPGVGKNLFADCLSILATGEACDPKPYTDDEDEQRKFLTSAFRSGGDLFVFDEAHKLSGRAMARALTSEHYSDRILGASVMAKFPNRVTWISLGNNVQLHGDMSRRVYRIQLAPDVANPMDRPLTDFTHPDLRGWTHQNRAQLVAAALTLIRAWFAADQPDSVRGGAFGSFEHWGRMIGGICDLAGQTGFLENLTTWRSENDNETHYWLEHLSWARDTFGAEDFTSRQLRDRALADASNYPCPPGADDLMDRQYAKTVGMAYAKMQNRWVGKYRIVKVGRTEGHSSKWLIQVKEDLTGNSPNAENILDDTWVSEEDSWQTRQNAQRVGGGGDGGDPYNQARIDINSSLEIPPNVCRPAGADPVPLVPLSPSPLRGTVHFDIETGNADDLHWHGPGFVRIAGWTENNAVEISTDLDTFASRLSGADLIVGHNAMGFDLPALARHHGLDLWPLVERGAVFDTLLAARHIDPPPARAKGRAMRAYDLDTLGERFGLGGKHGDLKALAKQHGGYDQIPTDDTAYRSYLIRDVALSQAVFEQLWSQVHVPHAGRWVLDPYLTREHKVAALAAQIGLNGFRVDTELLAARLAAGAQRKAGHLAELAARYDIPLADDKGRPYKSPLATKAGKQALEAAFTRLGVFPDQLPRTAKTGALTTTGEAMTDLAESYLGTPAADRVSELCALIAAVTGERTIYQTIDAHTHDGRCYPGVSMEQATGRWSITRPGLTVVGKRGGRHVEREVFLADEGHVIVSVDLAQVDARSVAVLSRDQAYRSMFAPGRDLHAEVSMRVWGTPDRREDAKAIGHGWNYGMGIAKLATETGLGEVAARQFDQAMRDMFPRLVQWKEEIAEIARSGALLDNGFGRKMRPDPDRAHTQGPAFMGQGAARDVMMHGLLNLPRETHPYLRAVVHDEVVLSVPAELAGDVERTVSAAMSFDWDGVPIVAEPQKATGANWSDVYAKG